MPCILHKFGSEFCLFSNFKINTNPRRSSAQNWKIRRFILTILPGTDSKFLSNIDIYPIYSNYIDILTHKQMVYQTCKLMCIEIKYAHLVYMLFMYIDYTWNFVPSIKLLMGYPFFSGFLGMSCLHVAPKRHPTLLRLGMRCRAKGKPGAVVPKLVQNGGILKMFVWCLQFFCCFFWFRFLFYPPGNYRISPTSRHFWVDDFFPFPVRWDLWVPRRVTFYHVGFMTIQWPFIGNVFFLLSNHLKQIQVMISSEDSPKVFIKLVPFLYMFFQKAAAEPFCIKNGDSSLQT